MSSDDKILAMLRREWPGATWRWTHPEVTETHSYYARIADFGSVNVYGNINDEEWWADLNDEEIAFGDDPATVIRAARLRVIEALCICLSDCGLSITVEAFGLGGEE